MIENKYNLIDKVWLPSLTFFKSSSIRTNFHNTSKLPFFVSIRSTVFPLLDFSPWPIFSALSVFILVSGFASFFNFYENSAFFIFSGLILILFGFRRWTKDYLRELVWLSGTKWLYRSNLAVGFFLFIVSEIMFFFSFFWGFFHSSIEPSIQLGNIWPLIEGLPVESLWLPFCNTVILIVSALALTVTQFSNLMAFSLSVEVSFFCLTFCAVAFLQTQHHEYSLSFIQICDAILGSALYMLTSFHGIHVFIGTVYLVSVGVRYWLGGQLYPRFNKELNYSGWYWHFVDAVWVWVVIFIYLWGCFLVPSENALSYFSAI